MTTSDAVCPVCFTTFPPGEISADYPTCPHCESEAIVVDVVPVERFLRENSLTELEGMLRSWNHTEGFYPEYKVQKASRIQLMIDRKRRTA